MFRECEIGLVGLGAMGRNLALNLADHGFSVAVYNRTGERTREFIEKEAGGRSLWPAYSTPEFLKLLQKPRTIIILVAAGPPVDAVIRELLPHLKPGDLLIDGGNSHFIDTDRRARVLARKDVHLLGMGISGGELGARHGPSLMPGGPRKEYDRVEPVLNEIAAKVNGEPCVAYMGTGSAGHYVKMVHNGIEYGLMQLVAETYDMLKCGLGLGSEELAEIYTGWNQGELNSYLLEITADIFRRRDDRTGQPLIDLIMDVAKQKGTGKWASWDAMDLMVPTPTIDVAVAMRGLSRLKEERQVASQLLPHPKPGFKTDRSGFVTKLRNALGAASIVAYAQGLAQLREASRAYNYGINLESVARVWRGGCIIRAALLEDIRAAFRVRSDLPNLLLDPHLREQVLAREADWREVVKAAVDWGIPTPGFMVSLAYLDGYRRQWLPANLIQAQRDYFGAHTYERRDAQGSFHTDWQKSK